MADIEVERIRQTGITDRNANRGGPQDLWPEIINKALSNEKIMTKLLDNLPNLFNVIKR